MKKTLFTFILLPLLASCGGKHDTFLIEGTFKGFNQGELYIYATDGPSQKLDTIAIVNGGFYSTLQLTSRKIINNHLARLFVPTITNRVGRVGGIILIFSS